MIPPTGLAKGPFGPGSNQQWVYSTPSHPAKTLRRLIREGDLTQKVVQEALQQAMRRYPKVQREQMAVLDYIMGNTDRHLGNFRTDRHGGIVAIDNTLSFPEVPDSRFGIRSGFVKEFHHARLSTEVMQCVRALDPHQLHAAWTAAGISDKAITGALQRLQEIRNNGTITGAAWPGTLNTSTVALETLGLPAGWIEI